MWIYTRIRHSKKQQRQRQRQRQRRQQQQASLPSVPTLGQCISTGPCIISLSDLHRRGAFVVIHIPSRKVCLKQQQPPPPQPPKLFWLKLPRLSKTFCVELDSVCVRQCRWRCCCSFFVDLGPSSVRKAIRWTQVRRRTWSLLWRRKRMRRSSSCNRRLCRVSPWLTLLRLPSPVCHAAVCLRRDVVEAWPGSL